MRRLWRRRSGAVEALGESPVSPRNDTEVLVQMRAQVLGSAAVHGGGGLGVVEMTGAESVALQGCNVLVPAKLPSSEERDAPLIPLEQPDMGDAEFASHLLCPARWVLPLDGDLQLSSPQGALIAREAADAYSLMVDSNLTPRAPVVVVGSGVTATLACRLVATRSCTPLRLSSVDGRAELEKSLAEQPGRTTVLVATDDSALMECAAELVPSLDRPVVAVLDVGISAGATDLGALANAGATVIGVRGAHPDLLAELAALVVKGELSLDSLLEVRDLEGVGDLAPCLLSLSA